MLPFPVVIRAQSYDEYHDNASIIRYIIVNAHTILMYVTPAESGESSPINYRGTFSVSFSLSHMRMKCFLNKCGLAIISRRFLR